VDLKTIYIESGQKTPQIDLNHLTGELIFSGKSILENPAKLYEGILEWVQEYINTPRQTTNLRLNIEYLTLPP
jgi:hypothetical protein